MSITKQNIIANFASKGCQALMSLAFIPLYIKFIGIESYGLVGIFASLLAIFSLLDMGLSTTLNRELARYSVMPGKSQEMRDLVRTLEIPYWGIAVFVGLVQIALSGPIANYWVKTEDVSPATVKQALMIMGIVLAFRWPMGLYSGGLMGLQKQVLLGVITIFASCLRGVGAVLVLWLISPTIQVFFLWQIFASLVHTLLMFFFLWRSLPVSNHRPRFQKKTLSRIWRFAAGMTGISLTSIILMQTDKIVLSKILSLEMFGYYSLASVVASSLYYFVSPIYTAFFPRFSQLVSSDDQAVLINLYHKSCQFMSAIIFPVSIVISFFSFEIMSLWTNDPVIASNTHLIVSFIITGTALNGVMNLPYALQLAHGWVKLALYTNIIASIILVPLIYFLATRYGVVGAASAWVILNTGYVLISIQIMHTKLLKDQKWRWYLYDVGIPLFVSVLVAITWRLLMPDGMSRISMLVYLGAVSATTLFAASMASSVVRAWFLQKIITVWSLYAGQARAK